MPDSKTDYERDQQRFERKIVPITIGPSKGGQNPPNTSTLRPPAPVGSGSNIIKHVDKLRMKVFTVIGSSLDADGIRTITLVQPCAGIHSAMGHAEDFVQKGSNPQQLNELYFTSELNGGYLEAHIYEGVIR